MKDAYSFHTALEDLDRTYQQMYKAYETIFKRCGLPVIAVEAESGPIGGSASHEFMVLTDVPKVKLGFGTPEEREVDRLKATEARKYLREGHFLEGSMAPKVLACIRFIEYGGEEAIITSLDRAWPAMQNQEGTHFVP